MESNSHPTRRSGSMWIAISHIVTAIGPGVLIMGWATAQLGWIAGTITMILCSLVTMYTTGILGECCLIDSILGPSSPTYLDGVQSILGGFNVAIFTICEYFHLFGALIASTVCASLSIRAIIKSNCFHENKSEFQCKALSSNYVLIFGFLQILLSQIRRFEKLWWLSVVAATMCTIYSTLGMSLAIVAITGNRFVKGGLVGMAVRDLSKTSNIWKMSQAVGGIIFSYSYASVQPEIQDTLHSHLVKSMTTAAKWGVTVITVCNVLCGCLVYAALGNEVGTNPFAGFGFYNPYWLIVAGNVAVLIHMVGTFQVFAQPLFAMVEKSASNKWPNINRRQITIPLLFRQPCRISLFIIIYRTVLVLMVILLAVFIPVIDGIMGMIGSLVYWPLSVYFPISMYITLKRINRWTAKWIALGIFNVAMFIISIMAAIGSIAGLIEDYHML